MRYYHLMLVINLLDVRVQSKLARMDRLVFAAKYWKAYVVPN
jgi:hypothetical protein